MGDERPKDFEKAGPVEVPLEDKAPPPAEQLTIRVTRKDGQVTPVAPDKPRS